MKVKSIPSTWLQTKGRRLDCGPYFSGGVEARLIIESLGVPKEPLCSLTEGGMGGIFHAGREGRMYVTDPKFGVPFLSSSSFLRADISDLPLLSRKQVDKNPHFRIRQGWTLISRSGTIGRSVYARPDMDGLACSEHVMRVAPDPSLIPPGYLYAYLSSRYGLPQVMEGVFGAIIQSLSPEHIANLPVPRLGEKIERQVHDLVQQAAEKASESQALLREATDEFFASVGLKDITSEEWHSWGPDLGFAVDFPNQFSMRAPNFNPRFNRLCSDIQEGPHRNLGDICEPGTLKRGDRFNRIDASPEFGYRLIGQKHLFFTQPEGRWIARTSVKGDVIVPDGAILVAAQGTLGESELYCRAQFITGPWLRYAFSEHILRVIASPDVMPRGCLFAFMRSETAFRMLRSICVGTKLQDHHYVFLPKLPVPYPAKRVQERIAAMVERAFELRHGGVADEQRGVRIVEETIEQLGADRCLPL